MITPSRPSLENLQWSFQRYRRAEFVRRAVIAAASTLGGIIGLGVVLPQAWLTMGGLAVALLVAKWVRDRYVCCWPVMLSEAVIRTCRRDADGQWQNCDLRWEELARVEKIPWDPLEVLMTPLGSSQEVNIDGEVLAWSQPSHATFSSALRRCLTFSPDLLLQSRTDGTTLLLPLAALNRRERQQLTAHLCALAQRHPKVVRYWLGPQDSRSRRTVAQNIAARMRRLAEAAQASYQAWTQLNQYRWQQAREGFAKALEISKDEEEMEAVSICERNLAYCCMRLGRFQEAQQLYEDALRLSSGLGKRRGQADCHNHLNEIFMSTRGPRERQEGLKHLRQAVQLYRAEGLNRLEGAAWGNMGWSYQRLYALKRQLPDASWWQGCQVAEHIAQLRDEGLDVHEDGRWLDCALACHRKAWAVLKAVTERHPDPLAWRSEANQVGSIANIYRQRGQFAEALPYYAQEEALWDATGKVIVQDLCGWGLSLLHVAWDSTDARGSARLELLDQAMRRLGEAVILAQQQDDPMELVVAYYCRGQAFRRLGNLPAACGDVKQAVEQLEQMRPGAGSALARAMLLHEHMDVYGDLIETLVEMDAREPSRGWAVQAFDYCERAKCRTLVEQYLSAAQNWERPIPTEVGEERLHAARTAVSDVEAGQSEEELENLAGQQAAPPHAGASSLEDLWPSIPLPPEFTAAPLLYETLRERWLAPGTLVLAMFSREPHPPAAEPREPLLVVLPATREGVGTPVVYRGAEAEELFRAAACLRQHVGAAYDPEDPTHPAPHPYGTPLKWQTDRLGKRTLKATCTVPFDPVASGAQKLYAALIGPAQVQSLLHAPDGCDRIARIVVIPHGRFFNDLPFCALHKGHSFLIEGVEVVTYPNFQWQALSLSQSSEPGGFSCLGLASPELAKQAESLFKAMQKRGTLARLIYGAQSSEPGDPARQALFSPAARGARGVIIVAHGQKWPTPQLDFTPAVSLQDVYARVRLDCDLLALLVCFAHEQAAPLGGEWQSMSAAFLVRGARSILAAPYAVHVDSTRRLLEEVFAAMSAGESAPAALRRAQCAFLHKKELAGKKHPYYWALSLIGGLSQREAVADV